MFCSKCGKENNIDSKFCIGCGENLNLQYTPQNLDIKQKSLNKIKKLNITNAIINFIYAGFFVFIGIGLTYAIFSYDGSGGSGLILLALPFLFILAIGFLIIGIFNLKNNKELKISSIETISIIEICVGVFLQGFSIPTLIISIIRMVMLSKLKKAQGLN